MGPQQTIGHYRILAKLGEGGMGTVYRATDTKLNREVAVKVLPAEFAADPARMQRFEREAQVLAALNHPNIATIYGVEQGAIVMELVAGEDLKGPAPVETAIAYARQIIAALEAAHEKGIIHRDLKPANVRVTPDGVVKVLDFGLAKAPEAPASSTAAGASPTVSPTLSLAMTQAGMILGTAAYMAPEQARCKEIDKRADIWAFGVILYELLTGTALFGGGETVSDSLAAVILKEPDYSRLPAETPGRVRRLMQSCLQKDPKLRLRDIGDARLLLDEVEAPAGAAIPAAAGKRPWLPWAVAAAALAAGAAGGAGIMAWQRPTPPAPATVRFAFAYPEGTVESLSPAATQIVPSPDGRYLAFIASTNAVTSLWVRPMGSPTAHRLDKTEGANLPFWSPDGQYLAYFADHKLKKVAAAGGPSQTLAEANRNSLRSSFSGDGGTWNTAGEIVFCTGASPLLRTTAAGGPPTPVTTLDEAGGEVRHSWPQFLPDGKHVLYVAVNADPEKSGIYVQEPGSPTRLLVKRNATRGVWASPGYLLFVRDATLFAQRMDPKSFRLTGEPTPIAEDVSANDSNGRSSFAVSANGVLVYRGGEFSQDGQLAWVDRQGKRVGVVGKPGPYQQVRLSPNEKSALVSLGPARTDIAIVDLATGVQTAVTTDGNAQPVVGPWSPDSERFAINHVEYRHIMEFSVRSGKVRELPAKGWLATEWTADGKFLLCTDRSGTRLGLLPIDGGTPQILSDTPYRKITFRFSPDGKFVAYTSTESGGRSQIVVASFPSFAEKRQVSVEEGRFPAWRKDGRELYFNSGGNVMRVEIKTEPRIEASVPQALFPIGRSAFSSLFAVTGDGTRFLTIDRPRNTRAEETMVVVNWTSELQDKK